jgi:putative Mn2+ efflux pump MntP
MSNTVLVLAVIALGCWIASILPQVPEKYVAAVGGILLAVAIIVSQRV